MVTPHESVILGNSPRGRRTMAIEVFSPNFHTKKRKKYAASRVNLCYILFFFFFFFFALLYLRPCQIGQLLC